LVQNVSVSIPNRSGDSIEFLPHGLCTFVAGVAHSHFCGKLLIDSIACAYFWLTSVWSGAYRKNSNHVFLDFWDLPNRFKLINEF